MDDSNLLDLYPTPDTREILSSLRSILDKLAAHEASATSPWPHAILNNPNLTKKSILVKPDLTGVACVLDWRGLSIQPMCVGMAHLQTLLCELPHNDELQRQVILDFQDAADALAPCSEPVPTTKVLLQAQALGHVLEYNDIAAVHHHKCHRHHRRLCCQAMQRRLSECCLLLWERRHFGLKFGATPKPPVQAIEDGKAETESGDTLNPGLKRTRSSACIDVGAGTTLVDRTVKKYKEDAIKIERSMLPVITIC